jgi:Sec-independent protein translocase protein TatA
MLEALPGPQELAIVLAIIVLLFGVARVAYSFVAGIADGAKK